MDQELICIAENTVISDICQDTASELAGSRFSATSYREDENTGVPVAAEGYLGKFGRLS